RSGRTPARAGDGVPPADVYRRGHRVATAYRDDTRPDGSEANSGAEVKVLGINAIFHDSAAALVIDGKIVAAAEEERFSRRKHGKRPVPFAAWELPEQAMAWCLAEGGVDPGELDAVAYAYDPD